MCLREEETDALSPSADGDLSGRVTLKGMTSLPQVGKNYDLVLLEEGRILSVSGGGRGIGFGDPLSRLGLSVEDEAKVTRFLRNGGSMMAHPLIGTRGYAVFYGLPGYPGRGMGILPYAPGASVERVVRESFPRSVVYQAGEGSPTRTAPSAKMREEDCVTYELLGGITALWQRILYPPAETEALFYRLRFMWEQIALLLGVPALPLRTDTEGASESLRFPLPMAAVGFCLLCLYAGLFRAFPKTYERVAATLDPGGRLVLSQPAGNRTHIPPEWEAAHRLAMACGMHFVLSRRRDAIEAEFAPALGVGREETVFTR